MKKWLDKYQSGSQVNYTRDELLNSYRPPIIENTAAPIRVPKPLYYDGTRLVNGPSAGLTKAQLKSVSQNLKNRAEQEKKQKLEEYKAAETFHKYNPLAIALGTREEPVSTFKPTTRELLYGAGAGIGEFYDVPNIGIANDFVNPLSLVSKGIIQPWLQAPLQAQQSDSYLPYFNAALSTALTVPMVKPASIAAKTILNPRNIYTGALKTNAFLNNVLRNQSLGSSNALNLEELRRAYHNSERFLQPEELRFLHKHGHGLRENYRTSSNIWNNQQNLSDEQLNTLSDIVQHNNQLPAPPSEIQFMPDGSTRVSYENLDFDFARFQDRLRRHQTLENNISNQSGSIDLRRPINGYAPGTPEWDLFNDIIQDSRGQNWQQTWGTNNWNPNTSTSFKPKPINRSGLTKEEVLAKASAKDKDVVSKMSESEFENTVLKPNGEITTYKPGTEVEQMTYDLGNRRLKLKDATEMSNKEYEELFNSRLDLADEIIAQRNKSGVEYRLKGLKDGRLTFYTPPGQTIKTPPTIKNKSFSEIMNTPVSDFFSKTITIPEGESTWMVGVNPGQWRGNVEDIANTEYFRSIPGLEMSNTTSGVFADHTPRKGTGAYEAINEYLKRLDLGRVKPGFNSQTDFSRGAWENFIKSGRGVGFYANPKTVYGTMKSVFPYVGAGYLGYEGLKGAAALQQKQKGGEKDLLYGKGKYTPSSVDATNVNIPKYIPPILVAPRTTPSGIPIPKKIPAQTYITTKNVDPYQEAINKEIAEEYERNQRLKNTDLAKTFASFTPGNNIEAGVSGAETFVNMNPIITGPVMSASRLAPALLHPTNNAYWGNDRSVGENALGVLGAMGDVAMVSPYFKTIKSPKVLSKGQPYEGAPLIYQDMYPVNGRYQPRTVITDAGVKNEILGLEPTPVISLNTIEYPATPNRFLNGPYDDFGRMEEGVVRGTTPTTQESILNNILRNQSPGPGNVVKAGFPNPLEIADRVIPRPFAPGQLLGMNDSWNYYSPLNFIPGYGKKLVDKTSGYPNFVGFRKFGNSLDDVIESQSLRPKGGNRMGAEQISKEGNWAEPGTTNEMYPGVFEATMNPQISGSNIKLEKWNKRNGIVGTTKEGDVAIPLTDPGLSFNRRLPFSSRYVPIDKQKLIEGKFQLATQLPHVQSLIEKYGLWAGAALTSGYMMGGKEQALENLKTLNKYSVDPIINWSKKQWEDFEKTMNASPAAIIGAGASLQQQKNGGLVQYQKAGGAIITPRGQWDYPGQTTIIPSNEITMRGVDYPVLGVDNTGHQIMMQPGMNYTFPGQYVTEYPMMSGGGEMIKRADGSYSRRGLWDNIRDNRGSGKKPTKQMLEQEKKIRNEYEYGGGVIVNAGGEKHRIYVKPTNRGEGVKGHIMVNHPTMDKGEWDTIDLTEKLGARTIAQGVAATKKWHKENSYIKEYGGEPMYAEGNGIPIFSNGGYTVRRSHDRKGKTHVVIGPDGTKKYFGDSKLGQHPNDPARKKAFYARHKHNLEHNPYFRAFARATWANGGELQKAQNGLQTYEIKKGDTLSNISAKYNIPINTLANANNIQNPNLIKTGDELVIPKKFNRELKFEEIPTSDNKKIIIDNYSPHYDYIIEGDKTYYKTKLGKTWADISDNNSARTNLLNFINKNNYWGGYGSNEKEKYLNANIKNSKTLPIYNILTYDEIFNPKNKVVVTPVKQENKYNQKINPYIITPSPYTITPSDAKRSLYQGDISYGATPIQNYGVTVNTPFNMLDNAFNKIEDLYSLALNGIKRKYATHTGNDNDIKINESELPKTLSEYYTQKFPGDITILNVPGNTGRTYKQQVLPLSNIKFGYRNRGDYKDLNTEGLEITTFQPFKNQKFDDNATVLALDKNGYLHTGQYKDFKDKKDYLFSKTFRNNIVDFSEKNNMLEYIDGAKSGNPSYKQPKVKVLNDDGNIIDGSLNILTKNDMNKDYYGSVQGGRILFVNPTTKEQYLVSGSINHIKKKFKELKGNNKYLEAYTLDNGTYSRGLSYKDKKLTASRLKSYDLENTSGGNGLYIIDYNQPINKYSENYIQTPNIRTKQDRSYKQGHKLKNEIKNVVLHHTAYTNPLTNDDEVRKQYMTPGANTSHVVIEENGKRTVYASPEQVTFHAGESKWNGRDNVNDFAIGVEFQGDTNKKPLTNEQIESFIEYYTPIAKKYNLSLKDIITHQMIAPGRKPDISKKEYDRILKVMKTKGYKRKGGETYMVIGGQSTLNPAVKKDSRNWLEYLKD